MRTVIAPSAPQRRLVIGAGLLLLALLLLLYLTTLDNGLAPDELVGGDLITHQYAQVQARPSNAPGYPLYTMGGWVWFHGGRALLAALGNLLPNPIPLLSSYSTLWALGALALLYALLLRITRSPTYPAGNWPLAWLLTAFYAVTYFFWYYATTTEQYTSAIAQTLAIVYVYLLWSEAVPREDMSDGQNGSSEAGQQSNRLLVLLAFLCGLSLAHMLTVAFIVLPLVVAVLWQQPKVLRNGRVVALCIFVALLPLVSYWYVWVRGAAHPEWWGAGEWRSAQDWFWAFVSTAQGREELGWGLGASCAFFDNGFPALIWQELSLPIVLVGLGGIWLLRRPLALVLYATLAIYLVFNWLYRCANWYQVILPAYPLLLLGVVTVAERWENAWRTRRWGWLRYAPLLLLVIAIAWRLTASFERADSSGRQDDTALLRAAVLLDQPLPVGAGLFAPVEDALALDYLIEVWGIRPDLDVVSSQQAGDRLAAGEAVFSTYDVAPVLLAELPSEMNVQRAGAGADWLQLSTQPILGSTPIHILDQELAPGVLLQGYTVAPAPEGEPVSTQTSAVDVTLHWSLAAGWPAALGISLRPTRAGAMIPLPSGEAGTIIQVDAPAPLHGMLPEGGAEVADSYRVPLPVGADGILLIVYVREGDGFRNLLELPLDISLLLEGD